MESIYQRLHETIAAVCPIVGVAVIDEAAHTARIDYAPGATSQQQAAAQAALAAFDWSDTATEAWHEAKEPDLATLRDQAVGAVQAINDYLVIADTATNVQVRAEVKAIDQRQRGIIKALARLIVREWRE